MRNSTIWESASRPLFVRTVWLEGSELRRGFQRHFLLDYDTKRPLERLNSAPNPIQQNLRDTLNRSISLEVNDFSDSEQDNKNEEGTFLLGSAKVKLHEPFKSATKNNKKCKLSKHHRRSLLSRSKQPNYHCASPIDFSRRPSIISEINSRKNSLSQPTQTAESADELFAERVLHWLDLAGKEDFIKNLHELKEMEVKLSKTCKLRQDAIKRYYNKLKNPPKPKDEKTKSYPRATTAASQVNNPENHKTSERVKHITIIFNKEGQPIRFNRPVKNIDLCALSSSPRTTRRLAGSLASARLYKSAENPRSLKSSKKPYTKLNTGNPSNKSLAANKRLDAVTDFTNATLQKRYLPKPWQESYNNLHDSKKQLHIFMPTLPKKGSSKSAYGTEDGISELSHNFSELCRI